MCAMPTAKVGAPAARLNMVDSPIPRPVAGLEMNRYLFETDSSEEACAAVVVKNKFNALENPFAPYGANLSIEDVLSGPILSWPLGARQTAEHADGAIVMVLRLRREGAVTHR